MHKAAGGLRHAPLFTRSLREKDGPMLLHGLQGFQGSQILTPTRRDLQPDRAFLAEHYEIFRKAGLSQYPVVGYPT